ncbi:glycosyltransferase family 4 protein [Brucella sp. IR073]|uniref:glycosyltransferase family 4 protein n=1 Tax=unclassified Brucella TaxID=2632610 RepID=UPI003B980D8C
MRILERKSAPTAVNLFLPYLPPYPGAGSIRALSFVNGLVAESRRRGLEIKIRVFTATRNPTPIDGAEVHQLKFTAPENNLSFARRLWGELLLGGGAAYEILQKGRNTDILLASSPPFIPSLMLGLLVSAFRRRYVLDIRDLYPLVYADAKLISKDSLLYRWLEKLEHAWLGRASLVFGATGGLARHIRATGTKARVETLYNGFPEKLREIRTAKRERFTACFHGILGQFQDIEGLVEVAKRLLPHGIDVVVVGYGAKEKILTGAIPANLQFLGRQSFEDTMKIVSSCHIGLCLRRDGEISRDAFPVKVWEYVGLGLPAVVTPFCEAGEFLESRECGVQFETGDLDKLVQWIVSMRDNPAQYRAHVEACHAVGTEFTRESVGIAAARIILDGHFEQGLHTLSR